ncbi:type VI secretion system baseplate subunit TssK [Paralimibaculum aggregatum]|uniref:Type VI secretion system baseplate subunit TssK n=1 Tax=Paralimibaculum aggregatum TaxID=3036245 RepID=A0ABQ6LF35_9RHOB|nr:type VI secretion system baseplate subunit TssK [Limibaculum sp. NKW23]GMG81597.1 type VI secretion system baseplate subunit TssK [Limibaculum sp. NKW23]
MSWDNKVIWNEGLFLQPHHLQQQTRYTEALVGQVTRAATPYPWGLTEFVLDDDVLKIGKLAVKSCAGITPDGASFRVPQADMHPPAMDVPAEAKNTVVYLTIPMRRQGAMEIVLDESEPTAARFSAEEIEVSDVAGRDRRPVTIAIGKMRLALALDMDDLSDMLAIPVARVIEVRPDGSLVLDRAFIPTVMDMRAAPALAGFMRELEGMVNQRGKSLAERLSATSGARGAADIADFLLLIISNRALPTIRHLGSIENAHPERVYAYCCELAGEYAAFMAPDKRVPEFPAYDHADLTTVFQPVMRALRQYLSTTMDDRAVAIPLEERKYGVRVGVIADKRLLTGATFVLAARADIPAEKVRRLMPDQATIGPVEEIRTLVNSALGGVGLRPMPVAPRQIPFHAGVVYFELDSDSPKWKQLSTSGGLAIFVAGDFPGLTLELWAIRN